MNNVGLSGSYDPDDCIFLLKKIDIKPLSIEEKERRLQAGVHYSEMLSIENRPSSIYTRLFLDMVEKYKIRLAREISALAAEIHRRKSDDITIVSLARAGTPIGVLIHRTLKNRYQRDSVHYAISIVRDKGLDLAALRYILSHRSPESILFVDGWTAKGVITQELKQAIAQWNATHDEQVSDELCVVSDIGGTADIVATYDDYVIPSGIMNSTVSGLISRTVLTTELSKESFHGCIQYDHLANCDFSNFFINEVDKHIDITKPNALPKKAAPTRHATIMAFIQKTQKLFSIEDINKIKPGIAEATRVMLRRIPDKLILRDKNSPDVQHLCVLAQEKNITVEMDQDMPFNAMAIIKNIKE